MKKRALSLTGVIKEKLPKKNILFGKDFINTQDWRPDELIAAIKLTFILKKKFSQYRPIIEPVWTCLFITPSRER